MNDRKCLPSDWICRTCVYFRSEFEMGGSLMEGECHRHAPKPYYGETRQEPRWPIMSEEDRCGEYAGTV